LPIQQACNNDVQRKRLGVVGELEFRQPITEAQLLIKSLNFIQMQNRITSSWNWCKIVAQKLRLIGSSPNNAKPNVGRSAFSKRLLVSSLITVLILVSQVFYELPKWLVFLLILILVCQPLVIVFTNDHNKYK
jgi:hypothetical protein